MSSEVLLVGHVADGGICWDHTHPGVWEQKKKPFVPVHGSTGMLFNRHCSHDPALMSVVPVHGVCGNLIGDFMFSVVGSWWLGWYKSTSDTSRWKYTVETCQVCFQENIYASDIKENKTMLRTSLHDI